MMTVGELRKILENIPDDLPVACLGDNGDEILVETARISELSESEQGKPKGTAIFLIV